MDKVFFENYLDSITRSNITEVSEYWSDQSFMKNYVIDSHKSAFSSIKIVASLVEFTILHQSTNYMVFEERSKYISDMEMFQNNLTKSLWVVAYIQGDYKFLSCTTLSVESL